MQIAQKYLSSRPAKPFYPSRWRGFLFVCLFVFILVLTRKNGERIYSHFHLKLGQFGKNQNLKNYQPLDSNKKTKEKNKEKLNENHTKPMVNTL